MGKAVSKVDLHVYVSKTLKSMGFHKVSIFYAFVKKVTFGGNRIFYNSTNQIPGDNPPNGTGASLRVRMLDFSLCEIFYQSRVMALDIRAPNLLTKSQGVVRWSILYFSQKTIFFRKICEN